MNRPRLRDNDPIFVRLGEKEIRYIHIKRKLIEFGNAAFKKKEITVTTPRIDGLPFIEVWSENPNLFRRDARYISPWI